MGGGLLRPCPFCGGEAESWHSSTWDYEVRCTSCRAKTRRHHENENGAVSDWNRRAERTCHDASVDSSAQFYCSECECTVDVPLLWGEVNYCPSCGARVRAEVDE